MILPLSTTTARQFPVLLLPSRAHHLLSFPENKSHQFACLPGRQVSDLQFTALYHGRRRAQVLQRRNAQPCLSGALI
jgi:hypothetical protein